MKNEKFKNKNQSNLPRSSLHKSDDDQIAAHRFQAHVADRKWNPICNRTRPDVICLSHRDSSRTKISMISEEFDDMG